MATELKPINVNLDGDSAYDFRQSVNQIITQSNDAYEIMNQMFAESEENAKICENAVEFFGENKDEIVEEAKEEIWDYYNSIIDGDIDDLATIQVRRNQPLPMSNGHLPKFWYKIDATGALLLKVEFVSKTKNVDAAETTVTNTIKWNSLISESLGSIEVYPKYDDTIEEAPTVSDIIGLQFKFEDGSYIITERRVGTYGEVITPAGIEYTGIIPEYSAADKMLYWNLGRSQKWPTGTFTVNGIKLTDGYITQTFNVSVTLSAPTT